MRREGLSPGSDAGGGEMSHVVPVQTDGDWMGLAVQQHCVV